MQTVPGLEIARLNTSEIYYLDENCGNVFVLGFAYSKNTGVETTEQFILLHTRYVCDFLILICLDFVILV